MQEAVRAQCSCLTTFQWSSEWTKGLQIQRKFMNTHICRNNSVTGQNLQKCWADLLRLFSVQTYNEVYRGLQLRATDWRQGPKAEQKWRLLLSSPWGAGDVHGVPSAGVLGRSFCIMIFTEEIKIPAVTPEVIKLRLGQFVTCLNLPTTE